MPSESMLLPFFYISQAEMRHTLLENEAAQGTSKEPPSLCPSF